MNLTGQRFGRLVAMRPKGTDAQACLLWRCACDCGRTITVRGRWLRLGLRKSCGCERKPPIGENHPPPPPECMPKPPPAPPRPRNRTIIAIITE